MLKKKLGISVLRSVGFLVFLRDSNSFVKYCIQLKLAKIAT